MEMTVDEAKVVLRASSLIRTMAQNSQLHSELAREGKQIDWAVLSQVEQAAQDALNRDNSVIVRAVTPEGEPVNVNIVYDVNDVIWFRAIGMIMIKPKK